MTFFLIYEIIAEIEYAKAMTRESTFFQMRREKVVGVNLRDDRMEAVSELRTEKVF